MLKRTLSLLLGLFVELIVILDSKDLYTSLSTQRQSINRSVRADVNFIRYEFEVGNADRICWVPGRLNLADPGTKLDSPLTQSLQLLMFSGKLPFDFLELEASNSEDQPLGQSDDPVLLYEKERSVEFKLSFAPGVGWAK